MAAAGEPEDPTPRSVAAAPEARARPRAPSAPIAGTTSMDDLLRYVGFTDDDGARLRALVPRVEPQLPWVADRFYEAIQKDPGAAAVLQDQAQIDRLKLTLQRWTRELLSGPWDEAYREKRLVIGRRHVRVGLPQQYMFTAMNRLRSDLTRIAFEQVDELEEGRAHAVALSRVLDIELAIMVGTYAEEHERVELEGLRGAIVSHLPMSIFLLDEEHRVVAPPTGPDGEDVARSLAGRKITDVLDPDLVQATDLEMRLKASTESDEEITLPRVHLGRRSDERWIRVSIIPVQHRLARTFLHIEDLTDAMRAEAQAHQRERLSELGTMAASVAHEIRNPLAGISSTIQVISTSFPEGDRRQEVLKKVIDQVTRLGNLVGDLLFFSRPIQPDSKPTDLVFVAEQVAGDVEAAGLGVTEVEGAGLALTDPALLGQVLLNLIQNAWQAGAAQVKVVIHPGRMQVFDDGPGVPEDERERVFDPFYTTKIKGTGLGLPVARKVVEAMTGSVHLVESPLGGAGFEVTLPVSDDRPARGAPLRADLLDGGPSTDV